jgi:hypothetical protein
MQRSFVGINSQKYILDRAMYELKPVQLLRASALEPWGVTKSVSIMLAVPDP